MTITRIATLAIAVLAAAPAMADSERRCFNGYAYHLDSGEFRYIEHHDQVLEDGKATDWRVIYYRPNGEVMARKRLSFEAHPFVPAYTLRLLSHGDLEGIRRTDGAWTMIERDGEDGMLNEQGFEITPPIAGDSGFHPFVQAHFERLIAGETLRFDFVVAGRLDKIDMKASRIEDTRFEGERAVQFRAELDMWVINWFVDPLELVYDPENRALLEYRGISNMRNADGDPFPVRVSYYSEPPPEARDAGVPAVCGENRPDAPPT